jgi:hypothetical protein
MSQEQILGAVYNRALFDALPLMVFVVDRDVRVLDLNRTAEETLGQDKGHFMKLHGGDVLQCVHVWDAAGGCGHGPHCSTCAIRSSVYECFNGKEVHRRRSKYRLVKGNEEKEVELLITATHFEYQGTPLALLILEDISEMSTLRSLIPICAKCKKIRGDDEYWKNVEHYFNEFLGVDFTHGLCPECTQDFYADWSNKKSSMNVAAAVPVGDEPSSHRSSRRP